MALVFAIFFPLFSISGYQPGVVLDDYAPQFNYSAEFSDVVICPNGERYSTGRINDRWLTRKSIDGGLIWFNVDLFSLGNRAGAKKIHCDENNNVLVGGQLDIDSWSVNFDATARMGLRRSMDRGLTWETIDHSTGRLSDIHVTLDGLIFISGNYFLDEWIVRMSDDGGKSFREVDRFKETFEADTDASIIESDSFGNIYVLGIDGRRLIIRWSPDRGRQWKTSEVAPQSEWWSPVEFRIDTNGDWVAVGSSRNRGRVAFRSGDRGITWQETNSRESGSELSIGQYQRKFSYAAPTAIAAVDVDHVYYGVREKNEVVLRGTRDGGATWNELTRFTAKTYYGLHRIAVSSSGTIYTFEVLDLDESDGMEQCQIRMTKDQGINWSVIHFIDDCLVSFGEFVDLKTSPSGKIYFVGESKLRVWNELSGQWTEIAVPFPTEFSPSTIGFGPNEEVAIGGYFANNTPQVGMAISNANSSSWSFSSLPVSPWGMAIAFDHQSIPHVVIQGSSRVGQTWERIHRVFRSKDKGESWDFVTDLPYDPNWLYQPNLTTTPMGLVSLLAVNGGWALYNQVSANQFAMVDFYKTDPVYYSTPWFSAIARDRTLFTLGDTESIDGVKTILRKHLLK